MPLDFLLIVAILSGSTPLPHAVLYCNGIGGLVQEDGSVSFLDDATVYPLGADSGGHVIISLPVGEDNRFGCLVQAEGFQPWTGVIEGDHHGQVIEVQLVRNPSRGTATPQRLVADPRHH